LGIANFILSIVLMTNSFSLTVFLLLLLGNMVVGIGLTVLLLRDFRRDALELLP